MSPKREQRDILEEVLELTRQINRQLSPPTSLEANKQIRQFRDFIRTRRAALAGFMEQGTALTTSGELLTVIPRSDIYVRYLTDNRVTIGTLATEFFERDIRVDIAPVRGTKS